MSGTGTAHFYLLENNAIPLRDYYLLEGLFPGPVSWGVEMGVESQIVPPVRKKSVMLFRRGRTMLVLVAVFWLWLLLGSANFIAALFNAPFYALLALYGVGVLTLISLLVAGISVSFIISNRPGRANNPAGYPARPGFAELAPVIRLVPRRVADHGAALTNKAAAKWRDLAS